MLILKLLFWTPIIWSKGRLIHAGWGVCEGEWIDNFIYGIGKIAYNDKGTYCGE